MSDEGPCRDVASGADGALRSLGEPGRPDYGASGGAAGGPSHAARAREDEARMREALREARVREAKREIRELRPIYRTLYLDPCNLESRYTQDEIRELIAEGKVIELIGRWREVKRP